MKNTKISMPNPCPEDWQKMTPTDKGAFCIKCQFEVIDFTKKSPEEIRFILKENTGKKTCGKISNVQLDMVNTNYHIWNNQSTNMFKSKFILACVLVFGIALFTGCESSSGGVVMGDVEREYENEYEDGPVGLIGMDDTITTVPDTLNDFIDDADQNMEKEMD